MARTSGPLRALAPSAPVLFLCLLVTRPSAAEEPQHPSPKDQKGDAPDRFSVNAQSETYVQLYRQALALDPKHPTARFNLGVVLEDRGATADAIEQYLEAVRLDPKVADVHYDLARLFQQVGDQQAAIRHFSRFKALTRDRKD